MSNASQTVPALTMPHYGIFKGPNGLRAGWRLLIFVAILVPLDYAASLGIDPLLRRAHAGDFTPLGALLSVGPFLPPLLFVSWIMAKIEGRTFADYGLPWGRAFGRRFWQGAAFSFVSLTAMLLVMRLAGVFSFGRMAHGWDVWKYAVAWTVPMLVGVLLEDFQYRGYLLFTLATGIGFWPAAIVTSLLMGGMHYFNPSGHGLGPMAATMYCLVTCLVLRRTGDLWMPLGIHAAWDWGESYFYGAQDGGFSAVGHLFGGSFHGNALLTGGGFGPEASIFSLVLLAIWGVIFSLWLRGVKYPNPAAVRRPQRPSPTET
jgi:uncharacterized protein